MTEFKMSEQKIVKMLQANNGNLLQYHRSYALDAENFKIVFCKLNPDTKQLEIIETQDALSVEDVANDIVKETATQTTKVKENKGTAAKRNEQKERLATVSSAIGATPATTVPTTGKKKPPPNKSKVKVAAETPTDFSESDIPSSTVG